MLAINFDMIGLIFSLSELRVIIFSLRISRVERILSTDINCCCNLAARILAYLRKKIVNYLLICDHIIAIT